MKAARLQNTKPGKKTRGRQARFDFDINGSNAVVAVLGVSFGVTHLAEATLAS